MEDMKLTEKDFKKAFNEVISDKDEIIVLYSGTSSFISKIDFRNKNIAKVLLNIIEEIVTKKRTLILPAFSALSFLKKKNFYIKKTIDNIGIISKYALKKKYYRTPQPLHSYLVFGKKIKEIKKLKHYSSWGESSLIEYLSKKNARICTLGLPWNKGCAYLHRFEEIYKVPWRYYKIYSGYLIDQNLKIKCREKKYSAPINGLLKYDFKPFIEGIQKSKSYKKTNNKQFALESVKANCIDKIGHLLFSKNPWIIVKNKKKIKHWIKKHKNKEIRNC